MEKLKSIENYDGYFISNKGNVYSELGRGNRHKGNIKELTKLKPRLSKNGYERVYMRNSITNKRKDEYIHRLVAEAFIPNPENKKYVNHINCVRNDNDATNLEWATAKENTQYTVDMNHIYRDSLGRFVSNYQYQPIINLVEFQPYINLVQFVA